MGNSCQAALPEARTNAVIDQGGFLLCIWHPHTGDKKRSRPLGCALAAKSSCPMWNPSVGHASLIIFRVNPDNPRLVDHEYLSFFPKKGGAFSPAEANLRTWPDDANNLGPPKVVVPLAGNFNAALEKLASFKSAPPAYLATPVTQGSRNCVTSVLEILKVGISDFEGHNSFLPGSLARAAIIISNRQFPVDNNLWERFPLRHLTSTSYQAIELAARAVWRPSVDAAAMRRRFVEFARADELSQAALEEEDANGSI